MQMVSHRINTIEQLQNVPSEYGVEIDLRSNGDQIILHHDPFQPGILFSEWLEHYHHALLILNTKEEGLEQRILSMMKQYNIESFFFLDLSFPFLIKTAKTWESRIAARLSEYETIDTILNLQGMVQWIWLDCFAGIGDQYRHIPRLKEMGFKVCLVSPELQGRDPDKEILLIKDLLKSMNCSVDAVCTKLPEKWM